jgi:hypothetical protein
MSKFIVFEFEQYYPGGGLNDCSEVFDSLEAALHKLGSSSFGHVLQVPELLVHNSQTGENPVTIKEFRRKFGS